MIIKHILDLLNVLGAHNMEIEDLTENASLVKQLYEKASPSICSAYETVKFMDEMPGGFLIYYAEGDEEIIYANKGLLRIFQCATMSEFRELTGNSFKGIVHADDLDRVEDSIKKQIAASRYDLDYVEYRIRRRDGEIRWIEDYGHFVKSESNGDIFYVFIGDATEKQRERLTEKHALIQEKEQHERRLREMTEERNLIRQEQLRRLEVIEGLSINYETILYADLSKDKILSYRLSSRTEKQFGEKFQIRDFSWYTADYVNTWVHPEDRDTVRNFTDPDSIREMMTESTTYYINYRVVENGEVLYMQLRVVNVGHGDETSQIVLGYRSVDKELQQELEQKQILADALNNANSAIMARSTFLSNMSHDMRTLLNAIFGFTELARKNASDESAVRAYLEKVDTASRQLLDFIDKLLEISHTGSSGGSITEAECDLADIIEEIYNSLRIQAVGKNIEFSADCTKTEHTRVYGDREKIRQFVHYLTSNAVIYTNNGGRVSLQVIESEKLSNDYSVYKFIVSDNGIGISEEFLNHIFEPFAREKNSTLSGVPGMGLGLAITKNIVDMLGGTIDIDSRVGEGSVFTVTLRLRIKEQGASQPKKTAVKTPDDGKYKILLVEDNEINMEIESDILHDLGFSVDTAEDGSIAVDKMKKAAPGDYDLILMDIQMPVMNGWEATREIRNLSNRAIADIPIIALSANALESDIRMSVKSGMNAHMAKPIDIEKLRKTIEEEIQKHRLKNN